MPTINTYSYVTITSSQTDADSPVDTDLVDQIRQNLHFLYLWLGGDYTPTTANHDHDGVNSAQVAGASGGVNIAVGHFVRSTGDQQGINVCNFKPDAVICCVADELATEDVSNNLHVVTSSHTSGSGTVLGSTGSDTYSVNTTLMAGGANMATSGTIVNNTDKAMLLCLKNKAGLVNTGSYTGTGAALSIDVGFSPEFVLVMRSDNTSTDPELRSYSFTGTTSRNGSSAYTRTASGGIESFDANGFTLGTNTNVNNGGSSYTYIAFKSGSSNGERIYRTTHTALASGYPVTVTGVPFVPQAIIAVCNSATAFGQCLLTSTRAMGLDRCHYSHPTGSTTRFVTSYITEITEDGCVLGSNMGDGGSPTTGDTWDLFFIKGGSNNTVVT